MNRKERRMMESLQRRGMAPGVSNDISRVIEDLQSIHTQIAKITDFQRNLYSSIQLMRETLERKGVMSLDDLKMTEELYRNQKTAKEEKVKEILSSAMTDFEKIEFCLKELVEYKPGYEKFNLNPVRDLNVMPPVVNEFLSVKGYRGGNYVKMAAGLGVPESMYIKELLSES